MSTSSITITALTATPTLRGNKLKATVSATGPAANLPNLTLKTVVFYSSITNDYTTATEIARGNPEALDAGLIEEQTYYYWAFALDNSDNTGAVFPVSVTDGVACKATGQSGLAFGLSNGRLTASVAASALTISVKTAAGNDPSTSDSVFVAFGNATSATGNYQIRQIAAALSLVISNGSTFDTSNSVPFRLWLLLFDDAGTLRLGAVKCTDVNRFTIYPINEDRLLSATAEGGSGGADSAGLAYAGVAITSKPFRILGYLEWSSGLATAGAWSAGPDIIRMQSAGMKKPGDVVQENRGVNSSTIVSNTTTIPLDNTVPQSNEGSAIAFWDVALTPTSKANFVDYRAEIAVSHHTGSCHVIVAAFRDSDASASVANAAKINAADDFGRVVLDRRFYPDDLASHTYTMRCGGSSAGIWTVNGINNAGILGGPLSTFAGVKELMV